MYLCESDPKGSHYNFPLPLWERIKERGIISPSHQGKGIVISTMPTREDICRDRISPEADSVLTLKKSRNAFYASLQTTNFL